MRNYQVIDGMLTLVHIYVIDVGYVHRFIPTDELPMFYDYNEKFTKTEAKKLSRIHGGRIVRCD